MANENEKPQSTSNPELYAKLSQPRPRKDVDASLTAFHEELYALRVKHGITDLTWAAAAVVAEPDGKAGLIATLGHYGDHAKALPHAAALFRHYREEQDRATLAMAGIGAEDLEPS